MSTNWVNPETEQRWQQPDFAGPTLSGQVLVNGEARPPLTQPNSEEQRWRLVRRWLFPLVLVAALLTGAWWQFLVLGLVVSIVVRRRVWQLTYQRLAAVNRTDAGVRPGFTDLR
ncbi:hypothetical protein [Propionicimonas sp.]|uniref:hypothetical protein n=1 Tax=Propionicimonas sp. TaxID=1955623 RepID=UPI0017CE64AE|nr:hypothetical protein [Propionicimonas sp.]MBU3975661.1 hypothetical protein [Actinomycetota bacterium]MBA3019936.1 hypothetical protein [Propionicimonas sp.]MBU3986190.1 hypothetical protein [Actinomycetota bacterium]MBU4007759.1 hypothetical protein [Actinomycetota bacterium]MBU4064017.1 hypothetical protein [Actinomycetota bacterium]